MRKTILLIAGVVLMLAFYLPLSAMDTVTAEVMRVIDGDTFWARSDDREDMRDGEKIRIRGIDTPEMRGECAEEKRAAVAARDFVRNRIGETVTLSNLGRGYYRRILADVTTESGEDLATLLLEHEHARVYKPGQRGGWCTK